MTFIRIDYCGPSTDGWHSDITEIPDAVIAMKADDRATWMREKLLRRFKKVTAWIRMPLPSPYIQLGKSQQRWGNEKFAA